MPLPGLQFPTAPYSHSSNRTVWTVDLIPKSIASIKSPLMVMRGQTSTLEHQVSSQGLTSMILGSIPATRPSFSRTPPAPLFSDLPVKELHHLMVSVTLKSSNSKTMPLLKFLQSMMPLKHFWDTMMVHRALPLVLQTFSRHSDQKSIKLRI